jgi:hypothetical protein
MVALLEVVFSEKLLQGIITFPWTDMLSVVSYRIFQSVRWDGEAQDLDDSRGKQGG